MQRWRRGAVEAIVVGDIEHHHDEPTHPADRRFAQTFRSTDQRGTDDCGHRMRGDHRRRPVRAMGVPGREHQRAVPDSLTRCDKCQDRDEPADTSRCRRDRADYRTDRQHQNHRSGTRNHRPARTVRADGDGRRCAADKPAAQPRCAGWGGIHASNPTLAVAEALAWER